MNINKQVSKSPTKSSKPLKGETEKTFGLFSKLWRVCCLATFGTYWRPPRCGTHRATLLRPAERDPADSVSSTRTRRVDYPWCHLLSCCTLTSQIISKNSFKFELRPQDLLWIWFTLVPAGPCSLMWRWGLSEDHKHPILVFSFLQILESCLLYARNKL